MPDISVLIEHRDGKISDLSLQMLWKAHELSEILKGKIGAIVFSDSEEIVEDIRSVVDTIYLFKGKDFDLFNSDIFKDIMDRFIKNNHPFITMIAHSPWGMDLARALSVSTDLPLCTDCIDIEIKDGIPFAIRQIYNGKIYAKVRFRPSDGYIITVRAGSFPAEKRGGRQAEVLVEEMGEDALSDRKRILEYVESAKGEVDITQADFLLSIGRGVGDQENIPIVKELADMMGATVACSRPVVDKNWLPKYHQVGTSGKSVSPKVYLALGISGAFQHVAGITGAKTIIAVNKDPKAPIFRVADYGVVEDLFKIVESLKARLKEGS